MYLLDTNIFIEAQNRYYNSKFCPAFWHFLERNFHAGSIMSTIDVYNELSKKDDALKDWIKDKKDYFIKTDDRETQNNFATIAQYVTDVYSKISSPKINPYIEIFLSGADPWLIAKSLTLNCILTTHENLVGANNQVPKIPNVCKYFKVEYCNTFDVLNRLEANFILGK